MKSIVAALVFGLAGAFVGSAVADEPPAKKQPPTKEDQTKKENVPNAPQEGEQKMAWLGVGVQPIPEPLANQLSAVVPKGEGVLIFDVMRDSPAAKAGLQANDVVIGLDKQKVTSPEEFVRLLRNGKPGQEVTLNFVRGGKAENVKVKLGERPNLNPRRLSNEQLREQFEEMQSNNAGRDWETIDALKLSRLDNNRWRAEIDFRDKDGKKQHKSFEGTRHEIRKAIRAEKDLPRPEQHHLLRAMNLPNPSFEFPFPPQ